MTVPVKAMRSAVRGQRLLLISLNTGSNRWLNK